MEYSLALNIFTLLVLSFVCALYLLPSFIARARFHPATGKILALNTLLGWTVIFWLLTLIWSFRSKPA